MLQSSMTVSAAARIFPHGNSTMWGCDEERCPCQSMSDVDERRCIKGESDPCSIRSQHSCMQEDLPRKNAWPPSRRLSTVSEQTPRTGVWSTSGIRLLTPTSLPPGQEMSDSWTHLAHHASYRYQVEMDLHLSFGRLVHVRMRKRYSRSSPATGTFDV